MHCFGAVLLLFFLVSLNEGYKIAIFTGDISASQVIFTKRVGETLAKVGHDVTIYRIRSLEYNNVNVKFNESLITVKDVIALADVDHREPTFYADSPLLSFSSRDAYQQLLDVFSSSCDELVRNVKFRKHLKNENFDIAFAHPYDYCTVGLIHDAQIPTWIWLNSGKLHDMIAYDIGLPSPSSYVPVVMANSGDRMNFHQRLVNFIARASIPLVIPAMIVDKETQMFRKHIRSDFPDLRELARKCPMVMVNSHELYDFPQPIFSKIVYIAGLGMLEENNEKMVDPIKAKIENSTVSVLFSLGTVANSAQMPREWKQALVGAFSRFPNVQFFFRYEGNDLHEVASSNVHISKWLPQHALLRHPKLKLFITHGGYNSLQEAVYSAKPLIVIPLFGDQKRNAHLAEKLGFGYRLDKGQVSEVALFEAIKAVLDNPLYTESAKALNQRVMKRPFTAEETLIKWTEFVAEFKDLSNMSPVGNELSFIEYHNVDVVFFLILCACLVLYLAQKAGRIFLISLTFRVDSIKRKID